jgi:NitT/TauT family transport system substrate-binding protein
LRIRKYGERIMKNAEERMVRVRAKMFTICLVAIALLLGACGSDDGSDTTAGDTGTTAGDTETTAGSAEEVAIRLGFAFPPDFSMPGYYVSEELGYFDEENVAVELIILDGTSQVIQQLIAGNIDVGVGGPPTAVLLAGQEGSAVSAFYQIDQRNIFDIVVREDSEIQSLEDLEGRVLGVTNFAGGEIPVVNAALTEVGLLEGEEYQGVEVVAVGDGGPSVAAAFEAGRIDAYSGGDADTLALQQIGMELRSILPEKYAVIPGNLIMATQESLSSESDAITRFGRAFAKGTLFAILAPDRALEFGCEFAPESCTDQEFADLAMAYYVDLGTPPEGEPLGTINFDGWQAVLEILQDQGEVPEDFTIDPYADDSLIDDINDFDRATVEADAAG